MTWLLLAKLLFGFSFGAFVLLAFGRASGEADDFAERLQHDVPPPSFGQREP